MRIESNYIYLVSKQAFSYNDEGFIAHEEGTIPLKAFLTEESAQAFGHETLKVSFDKEADNILEPLFYESMSQRSYEELTAVTGTGVAKFFTSKKHGAYFYYSVNQNSADLMQLKNYLLKTMAECSFEKGQQLYRAVIGAELIHIEKIQLDL